MTRDQFRQCKVEYKDDRIDFAYSGDEGAWRFDGIMWKSEKDWLPTALRAELDKRKPQSVLEVGFGYGYTADTIQDYGVKRHIIVESHPVIAKKAREWAAGKRGVSIIEAFIQDTEIPEVDMVFDDRFELLDDPDCHYDVPGNVVEFDWLNAQHEIELANDGK